MALVCLHQIVTMSVAVHILIKYELCLISQLCGCVLDCNVFHALCTIYHFEMSWYSLVSIVLKVQAVWLGHWGSIPGNSKGLTCLQCMDLFQDTYSPAQCSPKDKAPGAMGHEGDPNSVDKVRNELSLTSSPALWRGGMVLIHSWGQLHISVSLWNWLMNGVFVSWYQWTLACVRILRYL
jgi:hypothetical protein